LLIEYGKLDY